MQTTLSFLFCLFLFISCNDKKSPIVTTDEKLNMDETDAIPSWIDLAYVMGHFEPKEHPDFIVIPREAADRTGLYLHKETWEAFSNMSKAASLAGHNMIIKSATRNFEYQKGIWERKWTGETSLSDGTKASDIDNSVLRAKKILLYSSMPGTSRHHWGTDIDINSFDNEYFTSGKGKGLYLWLKDNASNFGFCQPYSNKKDGRHGYEEENWHWTYMPLSKPLTQYCKSHLHDEMIQGFKGSETATIVKMVDNYILGINKACL